MGIMDLFAQKQPQPAQQQPSVPEQPQQQGTPEPAQPEGLDRFADLFTPAEGDYTPQAFDASQLFNMTPEASQQLQQQMQNMNFMEGAATPEMVEAIQSGGEDALKALPLLINNVAKNAFSASLKAAMQINQSSLAKAAPAMEGRVQDMLRERNFTQAVKDANPVFNSPAAKPILNVLVPALQAKYPNATSQEIKQIASDYITDLAKGAVPEDTGDNKGATMDTDWEAFFMGTPNI